MPFRNTDSKRELHFCQIHFLPLGQKAESLSFSLSDKMLCLNAAEIHDTTKLFYPHQGKLLSVLEVITTP